VSTREKPFSGVSAKGREKLEIIWVRGQNIEIFIKNIMFQDLTLLFCCLLSYQKLVENGINQGKTIADKI